MRLATLHDGRAVVVTAMDEDHAQVTPLAALGMAGGLAELIAASPEAFAAQSAALAGAPSERVAPSALAAPLARPGKLVAIGLNYVDHASEAAMQLPVEPLVFTKFTTSICGPYDDVALPEDLTREVDYEVELGVVIGRAARFVSPARALAHVFGYTVLNDLSARDVQFADGQWVRAKSFDTFCPMGPVIVTADAIPDPQRLRLTCEVNGRRLQEASTADMIFGVAELVSRLSRSFTLEPGDVIATGTPAGVGFTRDPKVFVRPGDVMTTTIEGIGTLRNRCVDRRERPGYAAAAVAEAR